MSSSTCSPTRKLSWVKKMDAEVAYDNKLLEAAKRGHLKTSTKPAHTLTKKERKANQAIELAAELKRKEDQKAAKKVKEEKKNDSQD